MRVLELSNFRVADVHDIVPHSLPLISTTVVMLCDHADAYIVSVRGRRSISVCVCVVTQAIVGL